MSSSHLENLDNNSSNKDLTIKDGHRVDERVGAEKRLLKDHKSKQPSKLSYMEKEDTEGSKNKNRKSNQDLILAG